MNSQSISSLGASDTVVLVTEMLENVFKTMSKLR